MSAETIQFEQLQELLITIKGQQVLLDSDVAKIYGVTTKDVNKAVRNNPDKFPNNYIFQLSKTEKMELVENFHQFNTLKHSPVNPKAFTEKGLYMLATILKSKQATAATILILETFSKLRALSHNIKELSVTSDEANKNLLLQKSGELITDIFDTDLQKSDSETSIELNFAILKLKHTIKKKRK